MLKIVAARYGVFTPVRVQDLAVSMQKNHEWTRIHTNVGDGKKYSPCAVGPHFSTRPRKKGCRTDPDAELKKGAIEKDCALSCCSGS